MKKLLTLLVLVAITMSVNAQSKSLEKHVSSENIKLRDFKITVSVDSAKEIKSTFKAKDFRKLLNDVNANEKITFEIVCNNQLSGANTKLSYKINGSTNDVNSFLKSVKKIRKSAINYYENKG